MQAFYLKERPLSDLVYQLQDAFSKPPVITRTCVKVMNQIIYNLNNLSIKHKNHMETKVEEKVLTNILIILLKGVEDTTDAYLKSYLYIFMIELRKFSSNFGIMTINSLSKEIDCKLCYKHPFLKNLALRALFLNLPDKMLYDFEKFLKQSLINETLADNSVVLCSEYFKNQQISRNVFHNICDYHSSFFCKMSINKHSVLLELKKSVEKKQYSVVFECLNKSHDEVVQLEACKALIQIEQEQSAPYVDKAVQLLRVFLKDANEIKIFAAINVLNRLSVVFTKNVARANREIEDLVHSSNKSISMLSILTLLKTGNEDSVRKLALKLEPYLTTMSQHYKIMAIETMEKLSKNKFEEYFLFLERCLTDKKGSLDEKICFKRFLVKKMGVILDKIQNNKNNKSLYIRIVDFLAGYLEDPEFYQLSMEILGILGRHLNQQKELLYVYNRLILDNHHVRNSALQTLFDLDGKFNTVQTLSQLSFNLNADESNFVKFLIANKTLSNVKKFDFEELGDLKENVCNLLGNDGEEVFAKNNETNLFELEKKIEQGKTCRPVLLTSESSDFSISLVKIIDVSEEPKLNFVFSIKSNVKKVVLQKGVLKIVDSSGKEWNLEVSGEGDFSISNINIKEGEVFNGVFDYQISLEEDADDVEQDKIELNAFDVTVLDFTMPVTHVDEKNKNENEFGDKLEFKVKGTKEEILSRLIQKTNLFTITDNNKFTMTGDYFNEIVVINGELTLYKKHVNVSLEIKTTNEKLLEKIMQIF